MRIAALAYPQEKAPRGATCPGRRGKVFFVSSLYIRVLQSARFGYRLTEMKHNKFKTNKLTTAASQGQSQKPQQECVCVCVCVLPIHSGHQVDVPAGVTQEEGHTGFLIHLPSAVRALIFVARRIQPFLSLVDREVEFCVLTNKSFSTRWAFLFWFFSF